ncbi:MAG TPA: TonB-dependent receptor [Opitutaceae bacterium]|nr:TonB-dependent receptor [Opitutaceae bacterium]
MTTPAPVPAREPVSHSRRSRRSSWRFLLVGGGALFALSVLGLPAQTPGGTGSIQGRVQNADIGMYLHKARIQVEGTNLETFSDSIGEYSLPRVPAGTATLDVFYTGLRPQRVVVTVAAGETVTQDITLTASTAAEPGAVVRMDTFVVASERETNAQTIAINEQRFAPNLMNVVSTDAYGEINQGNLGEFVKHIPGVNIEFKDGNNPSGIDIRGFGTNYTRVTQDGNSIASAAIANTQTPNRQFVLEGASINNLSRIEVTKEPLPDTPANTMGGSVNLVSKSAFEYAARQINFSTYLSANSYAMGLGKRGGIDSGKTYTTLPSLSGNVVLPLSKTLGIVVNVANYDQFYITKKMAPARQFKSYGATTVNPFTQSMSASVAPNEVVSTSASAKVDWKPSPGNLFSFTASALAYRQDSASRTISYSVGNAQPQGWGETFTHGATTAATGGNSMGGGWQNRNALTRFVGVNYRFNRGQWDIKLAATYSNANNRVRDIDKGFFTQVGTTLHAINTKISGIKGATVSFDGIDNGTSGVGKVTVLDQNGAAVDTTKLANYDMGQLGSQPFTTQDSVTEYRADIKRGFDTRWFPLAIQVGAATNNLLRDLNYSAQYWNYAGPDGKPTSGDEGMGAYVDQNYAGSSPGYGLPGYQWASPWLVWDAFKNHPSYFYQTPGNLGDKIKNEATRSPLLMERVSAGYIMGDVRFFHNRVRVVGGVRYELTQDRGYGSAQDSNAIYQRDANGNLVTVNKKYVLLPQLVGTDSSGPEQTALIYKRRATYNARNYHDYFPSADLTYNITENLLFRAAFAKTTGRPSPSDIVPNSSVSGNATYDPAQGGYPGYINSSNTSLIPWTAKNYDLALEYYLPHNGLLSAGVFRKDIRNFFATIYKTADAALLDSIGLPQDLIGYRWQTRINAGDARIDGYELGYSQTLDFIPRFGKMFSVFGNMTKLRVTGGNSSTFNLKNNGGNIPTTGNAGVRFAHKRFSAGLYWNYRGKQFRDTSSNYPNANENVRAVQQWDANVEYQVSKHFAVFAAGRNINNAVTRWSLDGPDAPEWSTVENNYTNGAQYSLGVKGTF